MIGVPRTLPPSISDSSAEGPDAFTHRGLSRAALRKLTHANAKELFRSLGWEFERAFNPDCPKRSSGRRKGARTRNPAPGADSGFPEPGRAACKGKPAKCVTVPRDCNGRFSRGVCALRGN